MKWGEGMKGEEGGIIFRNINVNHEGSVAGVFIGNSKVDQWCLHERENFAMGTIHTNKKELTQYKENIDYIYDPDYVESPKWNV